MSSSIFNTTRQVRNKAQIASSEYALVSIGGRTELGQSVTGSYGRQIQTILEIGSPNIMWIGGHEQGTLSFGRVVGSKGFFDGWEGDDCGEIRPVAISLGTGPCVAAANGGLRFGGTQIENVGFSMSSGSLEISETISMRVATLSRV